MPRNGDIPVDPVKLRVLACRHGLAYTMPRQDDNPKGMGVNAPQVTIYGAGIFGLSVAYACARRGARVQVSDPHGVGGGSSGGVVGALAPHTPDRWNAKKQFQFESLMMAARFWADVDALSGGVSGYARLGRVQPVADDRGLTMAAERAAQADQLWQGQASWQVIDAASVPFWSLPSPTGKVVYDTLTARVSPAGACASLAGAITALGGAVHHGTLPESGAVVWATGYQGLLSLSDELGKPVGNGVKGQAALLDFDARDQPQVFAEALHFVPHADGTLAIGSTSERDFDAGDMTDDQLEDLLTRARAVLPQIGGAPVLQRWAGVRPRAKSRAPMLGAYPGRSRQFIANGGFKIGFGMAPKIAEVMADLVLDGTDTIPDDFRVQASL